MADPNMRGTASSRNSDSKTADSTSSSTPAQKDSTPSQGTSPSNTNANENTKTPSLASRIQSSASNLARSALSPTDYAQTLQSATQGKASSSASPSTQNPSSSTTTLGTANNVPPSSSQSQSTIQAQTFRNTTHPAPGAFSIPNLTEEEFQRAYTDVGTYGRAYYDEPNQFTTILPETTQTQSTPSETTLQSSTGNWKGKQRLQDPVQKEYTTAWERASSHSPPPVAPTAEIQDGQAVLSLLSDPNFDAFHNEAQEDAEIETDLNDPTPLSSSEIEILESFRREIQSDRNASLQFQSTGVSGEMKGSIPISSVSLIPDIDEFLRRDSQAETEPGHTHTHTHTLTGNTDTALRDRVLAELPGSNEWVEVQGRYHDEVWGYLRPALEAAREEIEEKKGSGGGEGHDGDGPAVRRLKMILRHMEGNH